MFRPLFDELVSGGSIDPDIRRIHYSCRYVIDYEDFRQDVLARAFAHGDDFRGETRAELAGWIRQIAARIMVDHLRRSRGRAWRPLPSQVPDPESSSKSDSLIRAARLSWLRAALEALDPQERDLLDRHYFRKQSWEEIARETGLKPNTLAQRHLRILRGLRARRPPREDSGPDRWAPARVASRRRGRPGLFLRGHVILSGAMRLSGKSPRGSDMTLPPLGDPRPGGGIPVRPARGFYPFGPGHFGRVPRRASRRGPADDRGAGKMAPDDAGMDTDDDNPARTGDPATEAIAEALGRYSEAIAKAEDPEQAGGDILVEFRDRLPEFAELAAESLRLEREYRSWLRSSLGEWKPSVASRSSVAGRSSAAGARPRRRWAAVAGLATIVVVTGTAGVASALAWASQVERFQTAEAVAADARADARSARAELVALREKLKEGDRAPIDPGNPTPRSTASRDDRLRDLEGQFVRWQADRSELDLVRDRLSASETNRARSEHRVVELTALLKTAPDEGEPAKRSPRRINAGPQVIASHSMAMLGDAAGLLIACRDGQDPVAKGRLRELAGHSIDSGDRLLVEASNIVGSEGGPEETRRVYLELERAFQATAKSIRDQDDSPGMGERPDKAVSLALLNYAFRSRLQAIQLRRASQWIGPTRGDTRSSDEIRKHAEEMDQMASVLMAEAIRFGPADPRQREKVETLQRQYRDLVSLFRKLSGDPGPSPTKGVGPGPAHNPKSHDLENPATKPPK